MGAIPGLEGAHGMLQGGVRVIGQVGCDGSTAEENKHPAGIFGWGLVGCHLWPPKTKGKRKVHIFLSVV